VQELASRSGPKANAGNADRDREARWQSASGLGLWLYPKSYGANRTCQGTTLTPIDLHCQITHLQRALRLKPDSRVSDCLILAIS
jgi:hypothetical protein